MHTVAHCTRTANYMEATSDQQQRRRRRRLEMEMETEKERTRGANKEAKGTLALHGNRASWINKITPNMIAISLTILTVLNCFSQQQVVVVSGAMNLPDGIENLLGFVPKSSFQCERDGYFGDIENDCRLFHLCQKQVHPNGRTEWRHWTYACGNQTMFNQLTLTCAFVDEAIPCRHASQFQYLNEVIHKPAEPFLTDADVTSGISYYSNRIMSDGARARAFEDSTLMAQIGGHQGAASVSQRQQSNFSPAQNNQQVVFHNSLASQQQPPAGPAAAAAAAAANFGDNSPANNLLEPVDFFGSLTNADNQAATFKQPETSFVSHPLFDGTLRAASLPIARSQQSDRVDLVENHSFQLQHGAQSVSEEPNNLLPESTNQATTARHNGNFLAPLPTTTAPTQSSAVPQASQTEQGPASSRQQLVGPHAQSQPITATSGSQGHNSFGFTISTNHQVGQSSSGQSFSHHHQSQQQQPPASSSFAFNEPPAQGSFAAVSQFSARPPTTTTTEVTTQAQSGPPSATTTTSALSGTLSPFTVPATTTTTSTTTATTGAAAAATSAPLATTSTTASAPVFATQRLQQVAALTPPPPPSQPQLASGRLSNRLTVSNQQQQPLRQQRRRIAERNSFAGFQSTRLTASQLRTQTTRSAAETPLVMRRAVLQPQQSPVSSLSQLAGNEAQRTHRASNVGGHSQSFLEASNLLEQGDSDVFWRRSLDNQLMTPKFESLLMRRRV